MAKVHWQVNDRLHPDRPGWSGTSAACDSRSWWVGYELTTDPDAVTCLTCRRTKAFLEHHEPTELDELEKRMRWGPSASGGPLSPGYMYGGESARQYYERLAVDVDKYLCTHDLCERSERLAAKCMRITRRGSAD